MEQSFNRTLEQVSVPPVTDAERVLVAETLLRIYQLAFGDLIIDKKLNLTDARSALIRAGIKTATLHEVRVLGDIMEVGATRAFDLCRNLPLDARNRVDTEVNTRLGGQQ